MEPQTNNRPNVAQLTGHQIDQLPDDTIVATDPTTGQPVTLVQVRALADREWGAWQPLDRDAYLTAYAVHVRGSYQAVERAQAARRHAERLAAFEAELAARPAPAAPDHTLHGPTVEVTLPHRFYDDHVARGCHPGEVVRTMRTGVRVRLDAAAYDDMMSDANHYADATDFDRDMMGVCASARGTVQRLTRVGRPA